MPDPQSAPINPFVYTDTPANYASTPEQVAQMRALSQYNMQGMPQAKSWAGVLAHALGGYTGNQQMQQANQLQQAGIAGLRQNTQDEQSQLNAAYGTGGGGPGLLGNSGGGGTSTTGAVSPANAPGIQPKALVSYYTSKGVPPAAAAGIVGSFSAESSGLSPNAIHPGDGADGSDSIGIGQWNGPRAQNLKRYAALHGQPWNSATVQADFRLVELGLAGKPGDPGYGSERGSGQALIAAKSPQEATVAALASERPGGWSPQNPMAANGAGKRLAMTAALMGGGGGGGSSGGGGQQVAQAGGGGPGIAPSTAAGIITSPWVSPEQRASVLGMTTPQQTRDWAGGINTNIPGRGPGIAPQLPGAASMPMTAGNVGITQYGQTVGGQLSPNAAGGGPGSPGTQNTVRDMTNLGNISKEAENDANVVNAAKTGLGEARQNLADIESFRALGKDIDSGALPMAQRLAAAHGFQWGGSDKVGRLQAYQAMAQQLLGENDKFSDRISGLSTTPEGKDLIANYLENKFRNAVAVGQLATSGKGNTSQRAQQIYNYQRAPYYTSQQPAGGDAPPPPGGGGGAGTSTVEAAPPPRYKEGDTATSKDGKKAIFKGGKWQLQ